MTFDDYLLNLFYLVDTQLEALKSDLGLQRLRRRGPEPVLHDSEVITMELAGEFMGIETDEGIYTFFRRYHRREFPRLAGVGRTTFARQGANLWRVKQLLHGRLFGLLPAADQALDGAVLWVIDSFPLRVCRFRRAPGHKLFRGLAAYGRDPTDGGREGRFFGFRVHLRVCDGGFCAAAELAPGNVTDLPLARELAPGGGGVALGDRNYWGPDARAALRRDRGLLLLAPFRKKGHDPWPLFSKTLSRLRQVIEPVIGQLAVRFNCQRTRARDLWHLTARLARKLLSHTAAVLLNWRQGNDPLKLDLLITE
jgi:Transposase DDE domain